MKRQLGFKHESPAEAQLLALGLVLKRLLRGHRALQVRIPRAVHEALDTERYGSLLYDLLAEEHGNLEDRLVLRVHGAAHFDITDVTSEDEHAPE